MTAHAETRLPPSLVGLIAAVITLAPAAGVEARQATVTVDRARPVAVNQFVTAAVAANDNYNSCFLHTGRDAEAVSRAEVILEAGAHYFGIPIMGWSFGDPEPVKGSYQLGQITRAIRQIITKMPDCTPVITLCTCPGWMKADGKDWNMEEAPAPAHDQDFASLCVRIANSTYPAVRHFQVWNEFKGFWNAPTHDWDVASYTRMYNLVYEGIKAAHPDVMVGGPYIPMEGSGTDRLLPLRLQNWSTAHPITPRNRGDISYWLQHAVGADFIVYDRGVTDFHDPNHYTEQQLMSLYRWIGSINDQLRTLMANNAVGALAHRQLPIWIAECYPHASTHLQGSAAMAAWYQQMELHHGAAGFVWMPEDNTDQTWNYSLFTNTKNAGGGAAEPMAGVFREFNRSFPPGAVLYHATSSDSNILALASSSRTMLINTSSTDYTVAAEGKKQTVRGYGVVVIKAAALPTSPEKLKPSRNDPLSKIRKGRLGSSGSGVHGGQTPSARYRF